MALFKDTNFHVHSVTVHTKNPKMRKWLNYAGSCIGMLNYYGCSTAHPRMPMRAWLGEQASYAHIHTGHKWSMEHKNYFSGFWNWLDYK